MRRTDALDALRQDLAFAARAFRRRPLFTAAAVAVLALGIGANTAVFSLVNAVLLRPLPYDDASHLVIVRGGDGDGSFPVSERERLRYRSETGIFEGFGTWAFGTLVLTGDGDPERVPAAFVDHELFGLAGIRLPLGRGFTSEEDRPGAAGVVIVSHGFWMDRLGGDPGVLGRTITVDGSPAAVVGVLPRDARLPGEFAGQPSGLYVPIAHSPSADPRNIHYLDAMARLAPGVGEEQLAARLSIVARELVTEIEHLPRGFRVRTEPVTQFVLGDSRASVMLLVAAVGLLLLLACANVAGLLLAQAESRQREFAVRVALGAGPGRLLRQLATESMVLGVLGGAAGLAFGYVALAALLAASPPGLPRADTVSVDWVVTGFAVLATLVTTFLFGIAPGLNVRRRGVQTGLVAESRSATGGRGGHRLRRGLVLAEVVLAVTIAAGAGFVARRWRDLLRTEPGFEVAGTLTAQVSLPGPEYRSREARWRFYDRVVDAIGTLPGVRAAGAVSSLPVAEHTGDWGFLIEGRPPVPPGQRKPFADRLVVTPGYFEAMRIPLLRGRFLERGDAAGHPPVVILSESVVKHYWPESDAVGARIRLSSDIDPVWRTVVGVVGDIRSRGLEEAPRSEFYFPHAQFPASPEAGAFSTMSLVVGATGDAAAIAPGVRAAIRDIDAGIPVSLVRTMEDVLEGSLSVRRLQLLLLAFFAISGLVLVAVGVYGVVAFLAERRTREFGVRMALGADRRGIVRLVLNDGAWLGLVGGAIGVLGAVAAGRLLQSALAGVALWDPVVLAGVPLLVFVVVVAAALAPALRAASRDPGVTLRAE